MLLTGLSRHACGQLSEPVSTGTHAQSFCYRTLRSLILIKLATDASWEEPRPDPSVMHICGGTGLTVDALGKGHATSLLTPSARNAALLHLVSAYIVSPLR